MVNENEMQQPDNAGVNIMNGFALDEQNQDGFFNTTRYYLAPGKSTYHLLGTSIVTMDQAMDTATILAKAENTRNRISRQVNNCLLYTSPSPRDGLLSRMTSSA